VRHSFPSAKKLARTRPQTLRARCRVGYRDARIIELARLFTIPPKRGGIDQAWVEDPATPDEDLRKFLIELPGIGPYAAANIMQLLGRYANIPLDTESVRHGRTILGLKGTSAAIMKRIHTHFAPFGEHRFRSYWFELWDYYESRHGPSWTWERDSTGKMFTAALLNKPQQKPE
jgi:3-methyladenine DNA glycosylase/8-oxoguanine DNA glycosylase